MNWNKVNGLFFRWFTQIFSWLTKSGIRLLALLIIWPPTHYHSTKNGWFACNIEGSRMGLIQLAPGVKSATQKHIIHSFMNPSSKHNGRNSLTVNVIDCVIHTEMALVVPQRTTDCYHWHFDDISFSQETNRIKTNASTLRYLNRKYTVF